MCGLLLSPEGAQTNRMRLCFTLEGEPIGNGLQWAEHTVAPTRRWLQSLGAHPHANDEGVYVLEDVPDREHVMSMVRELPFYLSEHLHSHSLWLGGRGQVILAYFSDALSDAEWDAQQRRFAVAQLVHEGHLQYDVAAHIARAV